MKVLHTIIALIATSVVSAQSPVFTNCAPANADMNITSFSISPYPICRGKNFCFTATGTLRVPITSGATVSVTGVILGSPVYTDSQNLCTVLAAAGTPCPVPVTVTSVTVCILAKSSAPVNINLSFKVSAINGGGNTLFCQTASNLKFVDCP